MPIADLLSDFDLASVPYFYSREFSIFFAIVLAVYWGIDHRFRRHVLTIASWFFYSSWNYRYLGLLLISTVTDYFCAIAIEDRPGRKKFYLWLSIAINLGQLAMFKYLGFFAANANSVLARSGSSFAFDSLELILPLGISFYTFQSLSYTIDVYRGQVKATRSFVTFAAFGSFFPQLIAGPIERAGHLMPQMVSFKRLRTVNFRIAIYLFVWGLFKKRVIADYLVAIVEQAYVGTSAVGPTIWVGFLASSIRLYADISGYADMARGLAMLLGIRLVKNFDFPYFSRNPVEFWNRWHISLSRWVRFYLFNPLLLKWRRPVVALFVTFFVMGLWHGAAWHYAVWGIYWATVSYVYQVWLKRAILVRFPALSRPAFAYMAMTAVIFVGQSYFVSEDVSKYLDMWSRAFQNVTLIGFFAPEFAKAYVCIAFLLGYELYQYIRGDEFRILHRSFYVQVTFYTCLYFLYRNIGQSAAVDFIYFQF